MLFLIHFHSQIYSLFLHTLYHNVPTVFTQLVLTVLLFLTLIYSQLSLLQGLIDAVVKVLPEAQHRYCVRHIESNWCRKWRSGQMRKLMWWCAWSSYVEEFKDQLNKLGKLSKDGSMNFVKYPPKAWLELILVLSVRT